VWVLLDVFWVGTAFLNSQPGTVLRYYSTELNCIMIAVGLFMTAVSGALMTNAGIVVVPMYSTTPALHALRDDIVNLHESMRSNNREKSLAAIKTLRDMVFAPVSVLRRRARPYLGSTAESRV
jgi:hypothetical protein